MTTFSCQTESTPYSLLVTMRGAINEFANFPELKGQGLQLVIDLEKIQHINSLGVQRWVTWARQLPQHGFATISLTNCPAVFINQTNMIRDFLPTGAQIVSFKIPYFCEACESAYSTNNQTADVQKALAAKVSPASACPQCGAAGEMDCSPVKYFNFLKS